MTKSHLASLGDRLGRARLYLVISDPVAGQPDPIGVAALAVGAGVDVVQVRLKRAGRTERVRFARRLREACIPLRPLLIMNDDLEAALECDADGLHLGQQDLEIEQVREHAGGRLLLGLSTHSVTQAIGARQRGADYIGLGAMFPTRTKSRPEVIGPALLGAVGDRPGLPIFPIGGITPDNVGAVVAAGGRRVAVGAAILQAADPAAATRELLRALPD